MSTVWVKVTFLEQPAVYFEANEDTLVYVLETMQRRSSILGYVIVSVDFISDENVLNNEDLEGIIKQLNNERDFLIAALERYTQTIQRLEKLSNERE